MPDPDDVIRDVAYWAGYRAALHAAALRVDELDTVWRPIARPSHEQLVAQRIAEMENWALTHAYDGEGRQYNTAQGRLWNTHRGQYRGGPVDWDTGRPA